MKLNKNFVILTLLFLLLKRSNVFRKFLAYYRLQKLKLVELTPCPAQFEPAKRAFLRNYLEGREKGSQMTLVVDGKVIFDINAGRDEHSVFEDLTMVFSSTKVIESLVVAMLVDRKRLAYEEPIAKYWLEFGKRFSPNVTVADLMGHRAGLEQIHETLTTAEALDAFSTAEKEEEFVFRTLRIDEDIRNGKRVARYHAITRGIIVDLLCYKTDGRRGREFIQQEIVAKLNGVDFTLGCPPEKQNRMAVCEPSHSMLETAWELLMHRLGVVQTFFRPGPLATDEELEHHYHDFMQPEEVEITMNLLNRSGMHFKALMLVNDQALGAYHLANSREFRSIPLMSVTGIADSRSLARIVSELACGGGKLISPEGLKKALDHDKPLMDDLFGKPITYTNAGWSCDRMGKDWVGWGGAGGSVLVFSPRFRAAFAYVPTRLEGRAYKPNGLRILKEVTKVLSHCPEAYT